MAEDVLIRNLLFEGKSPAYLSDRFATSRANLRQRLSRLCVRRLSALGSPGGPPRRRREEGGLAARVAWDAYRLQPTETYREGEKSLALDCNSLPPESTTSVPKPK